MGTEIIAGGAVGGLAATLQMYGPWALVAILMFVVVFLYRSKETALQKKDDQIQGLNNRLVDTVEKVVEVLTENGVLVQRVEELLVAHKNR